MSELPVFETVDGKRISELERQNTDLQNTVNGLRKGLVLAWNGLEYHPDMVKLQEILDKSPVQHTAEHDAKVIFTALDAMNKSSDFVHFTSEQYEAAVDYHSALIDYANTLHQDKGQSNSLIEDK